MAGVVTVGGSVSCSHSGTAPITSTAKLTVSGQAALLYPNLASFVPFTACSYVNAGGTAQPCATLTPSGGQASKLTAGSQPVVLASLSATTENPPATVTVQAGQSKLTAS
jgi:hypothetical protein